MKNLWTKRNIMDYLSHPVRAWIKTTVLSGRSTERNLGGWMKRPKKMGVY